jgi:hypothetical protein
MASLLFSGVSAGEIKRHPEVEMLLVTRGNRNEAVKEILDWLMAGMN